MMKDKSLIKLDDPKSVLEFLQNPIKIAEAITGILVSDATQLKLSAGRLIQASFKNKFLTQLGRELKHYREKGKIKEDYFATNKEQASLYELLKFIDDEVPDEERFKAMKSLFFYSIFRENSAQNRVLAYELMQICKKLTSGELLILKAAYDITRGRIAFEGTVIKGSGSRSQWLTTISHQIGHHIPSLVERHEKSLMDLKLIGDIKHPDRSGIEVGSYFRLTGLGYKLCEFITKYEEIKE